MDMNMEQIEARMAEIKVEVESADEARLAELNTEIGELETRKAQLIEEMKQAKEQEEIEQRKADAQAVAQGAGAVISEHKEERKMENVLESRAYVDAYANYLKTGDAKECRALLTENVSGDLPVPSLVDDIIKTAWENDEIMSRVKRTFIKGNLRVPLPASSPR